MKPKPFSALNHFTVPVAITVSSKSALSIPTAGADRRGVRRPLQTGTKRTPGTRPQAFKTCDSQQLREGDYLKRAKYLLLWRTIFHHLPVGASRCPPRGAWPSHRARVMSTLRPARGPRTMAVPSLRQCASASSCRPCGASPLARITRHQVTDEP